MIIFTLVPDLPFKRYKYLILEGNFERRKLIGWTNGALGESFSNSNWTTNQIAGIWIAPKLFKFYLKNEKLGTVSVYDHYILF